MTNPFQIIDNLASKYADLILQAIDLHPDYLPDDHELFQYPFNEWRLGEIFKIGNPRYFYNEQHIIDRFREKADAIANGNLFCVDSDLKTVKQYIELWKKIFYGLKKTHKELNTILTKVGLKPFYYYDLSSVMHTLDALVFLHEVKKYIHLEDHGIPNPIPGIILSRGGKETHIQYAKAKMKTQWLEYKKRNYSLLESELRPAEAEKKKEAEIIPFPTPQDAKWSDVYITFIDKERERIRITIKDIPEIVHYSQMGFQDKRNGKPKQSWHTLKILADKEGLLTNYKDKSKTEKAAQMLRSDLCRYFGIEGDPIPYLEGEGYKTVFNIKDKPPQGEYTAKVDNRREFSTDPYILNKTTGDTCTKGDDETDYQEDES